MRVSDVNAAITLLRARDEMPRFGNDLRAALRKGGHFNAPLTIAVIDPVTRSATPLAFNNAKGLVAKAQRTMTRKLKRLGVVDA